MPSVACDYGACSAPRAPGQPTVEVRRICVRRASAPRPLSRLEGCAACTRSNAVAHAWTSAARGIHGDLDDLGAGDAGGVPNAGGLGTIRPRGHACRYLAFGHADERIPSPAVTLRGLGWAGLGWAEAWQVMPWALDGVKLGGAVLEIGPGYG
jgi:hypothetical protein